MPKAPKRAAAKKSAAKSARKRATARAKPGTKSRAKPGTKSRAKPGTKSRAKPGTKGGGRFFHIELRPSAQFVAFRVQDVGLPGGVERVAGRRASGTWDTAKWLVEKSHAHLDENGTLVADSLEAEKLFKSLGSAPVHLGGDRFRAKPRPASRAQRRPR
jgi:hypothetical protein